MAKGARRRKTNAPESGYTARMRIALKDAQATRSLGAALAPLLRVGDVVALWGDLGAGKTELARGLIRALAGAAIEVASPTFNLVLTYDTPAGPLWHFDLYRVERVAELEEIGIDAAMREAIVLVEWPDRWPHRPAGALNVRLGLDGPGRAADLSGMGWSPRLSGLAL